VKQIRQVPCLQEFLFAASIDILLHPLHVAETRFIMQNRVRNFAVYHSLFDLFRKSYSELARGILTHIPRNFFVALTGLKLTDQVSTTSYYMTTIVFQALAYPFLTIQRRQEARSAQKFGLLDNEAY